MYKARERRVDPQSGEILAERDEVDSKRFIEYVAQYIGEYSYPGCEVPNWLQLAIDEDYDGPVGALVTDSIHVPTVIEAMSMLLQSISTDAFNDMMSKYPEYSPSCEYEIQEEVMLALCDACQLFIPSDLWIGVNEDDPACFGIWNINDSYLY